MPPWTQYLPVAGISPTDLWISQTDDERTAREARMSASVYKFQSCPSMVNFCLLSQTAAKSEKKSELPTYQELHIIEKFA